MTAAVGAPGFVPPPYPYDRLDRLVPIAGALPGGMVDLSIGTPFDPPPPAVIEALAGSGAERSYPPSIGTVALREAAARWIGRRFDVDVPADGIAACVGTKEFVATLPQWLRLRDPGTRHRALPGDRLPDLRDGRDPRRLPARSRACGARRHDGPRRHRPGRRSSCPRAVGQQPGQPDRRPRRPRRRCGVGTPARRAGVLRRVLRRVHLERSPAHDPRVAVSTESSPSTRCPSGRTWPACASGSTPVIDGWCTTCKRCASTSG